MKRRIESLSLTGVLLILLVVQVYPVFWILMSSFKTKVEFRESSPFALPATLDFSNFVKVFTESNIMRYFANSLVVTLISVALIVSLSCIAGFAIQKFRFEINRYVLMLFLAGIMIPLQVTLIPLFQIYSKVGWLNSYISVILPQVGFGLPVSIFLFATYFEHLPDEILEAALIDGCSVYGAFRWVAAPMSLNSAVTVTIISGIYIWNEFIFANTFLSSDKLKTLPLGLMDFISDRGLTDWGMTFAAISISILPLIVVYFILNKRIVEGMAAGAVKN